MMTGIRSCSGTIASFAARVMMVNDSIVSLGGASSRSVSGVSLHSYRYAWAERALKCGFPERFAQQALGAQLQGGASGVCQTRGSHRAVAGGLGKRLEGQSATQRATHIGFGGFSGSVVCHGQTN
jgi:hypothetical protein